MGGISRRGAAVADELETADNLTDSEEAEKLSSKDTTSSELGRGHAAGGLDNRGRRLDELGGVLQLLEGALECSLESSERAGYVSNAYMQAGGG